MTPEKTLELDRGLSGAIYHDSDAEQPFLDDEAVRLVVLHRRYLDPAQGACGRNPEDVEQWQHDNAEDWFTIPLFMYDHSGTIYRVGQHNPFSCPWDSGRVGIVALKRSEWGNGEESVDRLTEYAESVAAEYSAWANGECFGYVLQDAGGNEVDSCWGFIGLEHAEQQLRDAASYHLNHGGAP